jgi:hypothetical protein
MTDISNRNPIPGHRSFAHKSLIPNPLKDKIDWSNIPNEVKTAILDQSAITLSKYEPVKLTTRSDAKCSVLNAKQMLDLKKKRMEV